jgi:hypothetical protein
LIDTTFDFRTDTPPGKDPDALSPTLRGYHQILWSKPLPGGANFDLDDSTPGSYLHHSSEAGDFRLTSDSVIPTFSRSRELKPITEQIPEEETEAFLRLGYTIGGMMLFPGNQVERRMTINQSRGCDPRIRDRFDLTLECIRRHYLGETSPLRSTLARYSGFFQLFESFKGYADFFLLQDFINSASLTVRFSLPFEDFDSSPLPETLDDYLKYRESAVGLVEARNSRISALFGG